MTLKVLFAHDVTRYSVALTIVFNVMGHFRLQVAQDPSGLPSGICHMWIPIKNMGIFTSRLLITLLKLIFYTGGSRPVKSAHWTTAIGSSKSTDISCPKPDGFSSIHVTFLETFSEFSNFRSKKVAGTRMVWYFFYLNTIGLIFLWTSSTFLFSLEWGRF